MTASWDPKRGQVVYGNDEFGEEILDPLGSSVSTEDPFADVRSLDESSVDYDVRMAGKRQQLEADEAARGVYEEDKDKPFISGKIGTDLGKAVVNAVPAFLTDFVDLGLAGADLVTETAKANLDPDYDFNWRNIADDSDNPLTQWRRDTFVPGGFDTQAGEITNLVLRLGGDVVGFKWLFKAPMVASRLTKLGKLVGLIDKVGDVSAATRRTARVTKQLGTLKEGRKVAAAGKLASKNDYLADTFQAIAKMEPASKSQDLTKWWKNTVNGARVYTKNKYLNPKTMAETIAWDMFAAFNVMGEGDDMMDETIFDLGKEMGIPNALESDPLDSALWRKAKGMFDASLVGLVGGGVVDLIRIKRFKDLIKTAKPEARAKLVKAFTDVSDEMGRGIAGLLPPAGMTGGARKEVATQFLDQLGNTRQGIDEFGRIQADAVANTQRALDATAAAGDAEYLDGLRTKQPISGALPPGVRGGDLATTPKGPAGLLPSSIEIPEGMPNPFRDGEGFIAQGVRVRAAEPTISSIGIRRFSREMLAAGYTPQQVKEAITSSLPRRRVDLIEYMQQGVYVNPDGVIHAADGVWANYITEMGLEEGWARIDPQTAEVSFVRSAAAAADQSALVTKQAQALDELQALAYQKQREESMQAARLDRDQIQPQEVAVDSQQAGQLADKEFATTRGIEVDEALARSGLDPAIQNAEVNVVDAKLDADAMQQEELARLADEVTAVNPDEQVRELLGIDPDAIDLTLEKSPDGRGWLVIDSTGEPLGQRFTTKRAAQRKLDAEKKRLKADTQKRAQQVADDQSGTVANFSVSSSARDSDLIGSIKLTEPQLRELSNFPAFKQALESGTGKTFEFTQRAMDEFINEARTVIAYGVDGRRARMLKTLIDKFDTSVKLLEPEVRRQRAIDSMLDETKRFLDHGDYC